MDLTKRDQLIQYLKQHGLWAKKSLGQNFLVDREALDKIVEAAELSSDDTVLEIGPGVGTLTEELVKRAGRVIAIEKDEGLAELLNDKFLISNVKSNSKIQILNEDALEFDPSNIGKGSLGCARDDKTANCVLPTAYKLVANIPYYITSKILEKFLSVGNKPSVIVLLVQKEVAERICAKDGNLSVLAISVKYYGEPEIVDIVPRDSFFPAPNVDSAILRIKINVNSTTEKNTLKTQKVSEGDFFKMVKIGFAARRKTLFNNLKSGTHLKGEQIEELLDSMGIDRKARAQELSIENWIELVERIKLMH